MKHNQLPSCPHIVNAFGVDGQRWIAVSPLAQCCRYSIWDIKKAKWSSTTIRMNEKQMEVVNRFGEFRSEPSASIYDRRGGHFYFFRSKQITLDLYYPALFKFDVNNFELVDLEVNFPLMNLVPSIDGGPPLMAILGDILHIIVYNADHIKLEHYQYNIKTGQLNPSNVMRSTTTEMCEIQFCGYLVPLEDRNEMVLFACGASDSSDGENSEPYNLVYIYKANDNLWSHLKDQDYMYSNHNSFGMYLIGGTAIQLDEEHICIIRGYSKHDSFQGHYEMTDKIVVYNLEDNEFIMLPMELTMSGCTDCAMLRDRKMENVLTAGYIRELYETAAFKAISAVPVHVVDLISNWVPIEYIHVHDRDHKPSNANHLRISSSAILETAIQLWLDEGAWLDNH